MEIENLKKAVEIIQNSEELAAFIPEVRSNIVMAKENAKDVNDVAGIPGRITIVHGKPKAFVEPEFGVSSHMARLVLSMMKHDSSKRSAMNIKYSPKIIEISEKLGLKVSFYDRNDEPEDVRQVEGGTIPWGVETAVKRIGDIPDIIYHKGAWGKEPSITLIGTSAVDVAKMAACIARLFNTKEGYKVIFTPPAEKSDPKSSDISCIFCAMAKGDPEVSKHVLYNDGEDMVVLNIAPYTTGHLLVIPTKHYTDLNELNPESLKNLFNTVKKAETLIKEVIHPDGINIGINLGEVAGQRIQHIHVHLVPRFKFESSFIGTTANTRVIRESLDETYTRYMEKIEKLTNV
ncbi:MULTISPECIES: thiamine-phosphate synthase family protein [Methanobacterium]|uniref:Phosphomethylpyrimidine kinase n=1 Tax=Methanobacterium bryantii TaxID=2161 RepID=A0A2A2H9M7_METBR|nr:MULTISPECIES: thiamine-phosphate synthase family protein [Methanobacterium]OEC87012.1 phosphomethylpyrimidine kinase [Methanobacterium sp. A39]PAV06075.1 phosphomethylpyrimidine kinase [Methanobacterium bryantii]